MNPLTVTLVQVDAGPDVEQNAVRLDALLAAAPACDVLALPEVFSVRGGAADYQAAAEPIPGPATERLAGLARSRRAWVLAGSLLEKTARGVFNTSVLLDRDGRIAATYRKIHLFEANLEDGTCIRESELYLAGDTPVVTDLEGWRCGLAICYDLRFPELFRRYSQEGASLFFVPANFTQRTGQAHWEVLLRARAIENQCFVVAPGQCGRNLRTGIESHGHSLAVGPWGEILAESGQEQGLLTVRLDPALLQATRRRIPVLAHRRLP